MTKDKLKQKLRDLDRRITKLTWPIVVADMYADKGRFDMLTATRAALDQRRREVRRELKARPNNG